VPAEAEFVLEGFVSPRARAREGPFGEFTGYATGTTRCPVFTVKALTSRKNPIFQDIVSGQMEHLLLPLLGMEHHLLTLARPVGAPPIQLPPRSRCPCRSLSLLRYKNKTTHNLDGSLKRSWPETST